MRVTTTRDGNRCRLGPGELWSAKLFGSSSSLHEQYSALAIAIALQPDPSHEADPGHV